MKLKLFNNRADRIVCDKSQYLTELAELDITFKNVTNSKNLTITLELDSIKEYIGNLNYVFVSALNRYYFVDSKEFDGTLVHLICTKDYLYSLHYQYINVESTVDRNEFKNNGYLVDNQYQTLAYEEIVTKGFPNGVSGYSTIIMTVG